jgi:hypothetical protein
MPKSNLELDFEETIMSDVEECRRIPKPIVLKRFSAHSNGITTTNINPTRGHF